MIFMTEKTEIAERLLKITAELPSHVCLVAVSKTHPVEAVNDAIAAGQLDFGENRVQELVSKAEQLPEHIHWHQIGTLQKNKVKYIAPFVYLIHSVDSPELLDVIQKEAVKTNRVIDCLIQVHIATEETKFGFSIEEAKAFLMTVNQNTHSNVRIRGLMGMASFTTDAETIRAEFKGLKLLYNQLKDALTGPSFLFDILSMGMSSDYKIAIEEGSNMIRVGSAIFGSRH